LIKYLPAFTLNLKFFLSATHSKEFLSISNPSSDNMRTTSENLEVVGM